MKFIISKDKTKLSLNWVSKNLGPQIGGLSVIKESLINGEAKLIFPVSRSGDHWSFKDRSREDLNSELDIDDDSFPAGEYTMFEQYLTDTLNEKDLVFFTLKYQ
jgi:hypothetical protein